MTQIEQPAVRNRLLAALSPDDFALLAPALQPTKLELEQVLYAAHQPIGTAYFLENGTVSMLAPLEDGRFMEVGLVGREGLVGLSVVLGADSSATEAMVQMQGTAFQIRSAKLKEAFEVSPTPRGLLLYPRTPRPGGPDRGVQRAPPAGGASRPLAPDGARSGSHRRVPDDPGVHVPDAGGASCRRVDRGRHPAEGGRDRLQARLHHRPRPPWPGGYGLRVLRRRAAAVQAPARFSCGRVTGIFPVALYVIG